MKNIIRAILRILLQLLFRVRVTGLDKSIDKGGMLHVRGPNVMSGYYRYDNPGQLQPPPSDAGEGWYESGDVISIVNDGFVSVVGRVKRFAKIACEMVSLKKMPEAL